MALTSTNHFYPEIIDPVTLESLPYGTQEGMVLPIDQKEGMPLLRYRTKDLTSLIAMRVRAVVPVCV